MALLSVAIKPQRNHSGHQAAAILALAWRYVLTTVDALLCSFDSQRTSGPTMQSSLDPDMARFVKILQMPTEPYKIIADVVNSPADEPVARNVGWQ